MIAVHEFADQPTLYGPVSQIIHVGIDLGIARAALAETVAFVRNRSRPWIDSGKETAAEPPRLDLGGDQPAGPRPLQ